MKRTTRLAATATGLALLAVTACGGDDGDGTGGDGSGDGGSTEPITVWTTDTLPDRVAATEAIIADFTAATGIEVELVGVAEDQFTQVLSAAAAAGELPDVMGSLGLEAVRTLGTNDLADTEANAAVVEELGEDTFAERALELTRDGDAQLAVPDTSWVQLLLYRRDLFEAAGLDVPETYEDITAAAQALNAPGMAGFVGATSPGDAFTQQTFEHIALANGCQLVNDEGEVTLDSDQCVGAFEFYGDLVSNYSVSGAQDVDTVRAAYFAGQAAMMVWSTFVLDEMAGLRDDALPSCPECQADPTFLASNSGIVPALQGPDGEEPAQFGQVVSWSIIAESATESASAFVEYMMSDGYIDWMAIAPEGKYPVRAGTEDAPTEYADAWATLPAGVDRKAPLSDFYGPEVLDQLAGGLDQLDRWAITQGQGDLITAVVGEAPVQQAVSAVTTEGVSAEDAAQQAQEAVEQIADTAS
ncbi:extracellular solute-binding protein [Jiangella aurantiaca]|uniref:Extracellular solute-binding protein n=1 Tax=Jiangella aurantiaca TaxID=2530373 RepID=A0A4R5A6R8_9ACTN|nr:extracellular solute-binding protein [Jiangella aurantiaca]TDD67661.1 extracellular solute-binding protein [Jiangella aurantiaca]